MQQNRCVARAKTYDCMYADGKSVKLAVGVQVQWTVHWRIVEPIGVDKCFSAFASLRRGDL